MSDWVPLEQVAVAHYGKALKEADRVLTGRFEVFGSSGPLGRHDATLVSYPTLVIGRKGSVGSVSYAPNGGWPIDTTFYIERKQPESVDLRYLYWALSHAGLDRWTIVTSIPGLSREDLYRTRIPLPALAEQRRIAALLDKADAVRLKRKEAMGLLDESLRSAFLEMFGDPVRNERGWEVVELGAVADVQGGLQVTARRATHRREVPYLRVANVFRDRLSLDEVKKLGVTDEEVERTKLRAGDLLIVEGHGSREEIGRSAVWDGSIEVCVHQNYLMRARLDASRAEPNYVSAFLNSAGGRRQMFKVGKTTSGLNTISTSNVKRIDVLLPPVQVQRRYASTRRKVVEMRAQFVGAGESADSLFNSLAQRVLGGEG